MGTDIHVYILKKDKDSLWKTVKIYKKEKRNKFKYISPYNSRNYELFDILNGKEVKDYFPFVPINEKELPQDLKNRYLKAKNTEGYFDFNEVNLADLKLYLCSCPKVRDYDYEGKNFDEEGWKTNPVYDFIKIIENYIFLSDSFNFETPPDSCFKIVYWFDC